MFLSNNNSINMVKEEVVNLKYIIPKQSSEFELMDEGHIPYQGIELMFTDGYRVGINFVKDTSKRKVIDTLREIATMIEEGK